MGPWDLLSVSSHFFPSNHLQGAGGYDMTGVCFTRLHSDSSLWFPCMFWQEFFQSCLREVLENAVGKQPPGYSWLSPQILWRGHLEKLLWCSYLSKGWTQGWPLRPWPQPYFWSEQWPGIALLSLASSWLLWVRSQLLLDHFIWLSVLGLSLQPWFC